MKTKNVIKPKKSTMELHLMATNPDLPLNVISQYKNELDWYTLSSNIHITEDFIKTFDNHISWNDILFNPYFSCDYFDDMILLQYEDKINWKYATIMCKFSIKLLREITKRHRINYNLIFTENKKNSLLVRLFMLSRINWMDYCKIYPIIY